MDDQVTLNGQAADGGGGETKAPKRPPSAKGKTGQSRSQLPILADEYRYAGEQDVLYTTVGVMTLLVILTSVLTWGIVLAGIALGVIAMILQYKSFIGQCVAISEKQFPEIHALATTAAHRLDIELPRVYIMQSPVLNASAMGFSRYPAVVLHSALVEALDEDELRFVIGHEFSHIKCGHTLWLFLIGSGQMRVPIVSRVLESVFKWWSRKGEFTCDRGGLIACRDAHAVIRAQCKAAVGAQLFEKLDIAPFLEQKQELDKGFMGRLAEVSQTHPFAVNRIQQVMEFSESDIYKHIVSRRP